ncbi:SIS domain-containing protein [Propioniciclava tarda]|uniref:SIS domain-containing protein n=1 Tax=Propioniciclava tarda TaxID=433330 RepID=A0A4Q9KPI5_PROTD|nr:SIS domain-containing protein [Propioniciclava tarda]TBT96424.1 SIS domain-containing protein [Propioniciclava tarda]SMO37904.1 fructoselysine-6-phosphate deglycase [Propioniciclava tarda]
MQPIAIPNDFEDAVAHALAARDRTDEYIASVLSEGLDKVVLVGCGGSHFGMYPSFDLLDRYLPGTSVTHISSAELTSRRPVGLTDRSLVVAASHSGSTPETVAAAEYAKSLGARLIGISRVGDNGLSRLGDIHLDYPDTITITEPKLVHNHQIALSLLEQSGAGEVASPIRAGMPALPAALRSAKEEVAEVAEAVCAIVDGAPLTLVTGAGPAFGMAKMTAWCYMMEMLWLKAAAINGADFFHGPLEMILDDTPLLALLAEDPTRALGERVVSFASRYTSSLAVIDTAALTLPGVPADARGELSMLALFSATRRVLDHIAARIGHDTSQRRYMYKVAY